MQVGKGLLAFEGGKRVGRGVVGLVPAKDEKQAQLVKGGAAVLAVIAAAAYKGKNADLVVPALVGVAAEQAGDLLDAQAAKMITKKSNPDMPQKFLQDAMGLGCPCDQPNDQMPPQYYPMLASPAIREIEWETVWDGGNTQDTSFTGV
ncbi:MAG: hypothetical protein CL528_00395 [Aequorivita sp.]|nr:hypothetical protein [Aequorivita sp.]MBP40209.1 hypothetical protein [Aequorivita sp.]